MLKISMIFLKDFQKQFRYEGADHTKKMSWMNSVKSIDPIIAIKYLFRSAH